MSRASELAELIRANRSSLTRDEDLAEAILGWVDERYVRRAELDQWEYAITGRHGILLEPVDPHSRKEADRLHEFWVSKMAVPDSTIVRRRIGVSTGEWEPLP